MEQQSTDPTIPTVGGTTTTTVAPGITPSSSVPPAPAGNDRSGTAAVAGEKGKEVAQSAAGQAKDIAAEARSQAGSVTEEAVHQAKQVFSTAGTEVQQQLGDRLGTASTTARDTATQLRALADGRIDEAGPVVDFARMAGDHLERLADRADDLGVQGVVDEVTDFARRRPVAFLVGAAAAGFMVGRLARAGKEAASSDGSDASTTTPAITDRSSVVDLTDTAMGATVGYEPVPPSPGVVGGVTVPPSGGPTALDDPSGGVR